MGLPPHRPTYLIVIRVRLLFVALQAAGVYLKIVDMRAGQDIDKEVYEWIEFCDTFLVFGSARYGEDTGNSACTYNEVKFAQAKRKNIILLRMIPWEEEFEELLEDEMFRVYFLLRTIGDYDRSDGVVRKALAELEDRSSRCRILGLRLGEHLRPTLPCEAAVLHETRLTCQYRERNHCAHLGAARYDTPELPLGAAALCHRRTDA